MNGKNIKSDIVLTTSNEILQYITSGHKNYEFRKTPLPSFVQRIWFYISAPISQLAYICEIDSARTREPPLPHDGVGNQQFNERSSREWESLNYAYRIRSVYRIHQPITLETMKAHYGIKGVPRGVMYVPEAMLRDVVCDTQHRVLVREREGGSGFAMRLPTPLREASPEPMDIDVVMEQPPRATKRTFEEFEMDAGVYRKSKRQSLSTAQRFDVIDVDMS
ncbi:hypothetical protein DXG01_000652 [Tephrocybe rancida]|nr:hypothetical protein DXG01_000652 [Tephrocybe rancida]